VPVLFGSQGRFARKPATGSRTCDRPRAYSASFLLHCSESARRHAKSGANHSSGYGLRGHSPSMRSAVIEADANGYSGGGAAVRRSASTLRFYEEKGLIVSVGRKGLRRRFDPSVLERLALIALGRAAGFSPDEIALMFAPDGRPLINRQMLVDKADELDRMISELTAMRDGLRHAAACLAPSHMECPTFRRLLRTAASGVIGRRRTRVVPSHRGAVSR
jgi:DNA-binding transcriptional MerR regulator